MKTFFALIALAASLFAGPSVGQPFPPTTLEDQFGKTHTVGAEGLILISFERDVSDRVNAFLKQQPKSFLTDNGTVYIADISAMPTIIAKLFALPKMRDYPYAVLLNRDEDFEKGFDKREGKLTVYRLQGGNVIAVEFIDTDELGKLFEK